MFKKSCGVILFLMFFLLACQNNKTATNLVPTVNNNQVVRENPLEFAQEQITNYNNFQIPESEYPKLKKSPTNELYYLAANNKRYIFPNKDIFNSWFNNYSLDKIEFNDIETLYKTDLGGNVTFRPGSLMQTPTDNNIYLVTKNGQISVINQNLLTQLYGEDWAKKVYSIENYYFTNYKLGKAINSLNDFPEIPNDLTIDLDKGLK